MMSKRVLLKIGGKAFENSVPVAQPGEEIPEATAIKSGEGKQNSLPELAEAIKALPEVEFIIVHGGGAEISQALRAANRQPVFVDGLRVTTPEDMEIVENVLSGVVNQRIAESLNQNGVTCHRLSGKTSGLFLVEPLQRDGKSLGLVGQIVRVNPKPVLDQLAERQIPVISPISADERGQTFNVNADSAAGALAVAARCTDLVYFTDVPGVRVGDLVCPQLNVQQARDLIAAGIIKDGMIAKMESVFEALAGGVQRVHIGQWSGKNTLNYLSGQQATVGTTIHS
jgi:acetylglutamate kinase